MFRRWRRRPPDDVALDDDERALARLVERDALASAVCDELVATRRAGDRRSPGGARALKAYNDWIDRTAGRSPADSHRHRHHGVMGPEPWLKDIPRPPGSDLFVRRIRLADQICAQYIMGGWADTPGEASGRWSNIDQLLESWPPSEPFPDHRDDVAE